MAKHPDFNVLYKPLPMCDPKIQGCFRNSMIVESEAEVYFLVDGDEVYNGNDLMEIKCAAGELAESHRHNPTFRYGVINRVEFNKDLTHRYSEIRTHHRLYTHDAWWDGTHPGEEAHYAQKRGSEQHYPEIMCHHFHNAERSGFGDAGVPGRSRRKAQRTYHPGELMRFELLYEVPMLQKPIAHWPVAPALKALQEAYDET
jgi:hypothetical protein